MKIYIIGPSESGKTTFSKKLSFKYNTCAFELDCIVYDDYNNHIKRTNNEIEKMFKENINKKTWIIEDVGRNIFNEGLKNVIQIYYLKISKFIVYRRVITRWIKQRLGKEKYNYPSTLFQFCDTLKIARCYYKEEYLILDKIKKYNDKGIYTK